MQITDCFCDVDRILALVAHATCLAFDAKLNDYYRGFAQLTDRRLSAQLRS
jgi:hypothetical protein